MSAQRPDITDDPRADALADVILRDGQTLRLRAPMPADSDALVAFLEELSPDSRQMRFHGTLRPGRGSWRATWIPTGTIAAP